MVEEGTLMDDFHRRDLPGQFAADLPSMYELETWIFVFLRQHPSPCRLPRYGYVGTNVYE
jgi:hypothetical protein